MDILILNWRDVCNPEAGGAERATHEVAWRWVRKGHRVRVISSQFAGCACQETVDGVEMKRVGTPRTVYAAAAAAYQKHFRGACDAVIDEINTIPFFTPLYVKEPKIALLHQLAREILFLELDPIRASMVWLAEPLFLKAYKGIPVMTSDSTRRDLLRLGFSDERILTIKYGVDHEKYKPGRGKTEYPHVLYYGRLKESKGLKIILRAFRLVLRKLPTAILSIVGTGERAFVEHLKSLSYSLGIEDNVNFIQLGFQDPSQEKIRFLQQAWVIVLASKREGFGLSIVEANACGTPAVVTNVPGLCDIVKHEETGLLVEYGNEMAFAEAVLRVLENSDFRRSISERAKSWSNQFDWDLTADLMLATIQDYVITENRI